MRNNILFIGLIAIIIGSVLNSCNDGSMNYQPKGDYVSGYAQYADTNFVTGNGFYAIALFTNNNLPFYSLPIKLQVIDNPRNTPKYYRLSWEGNEQFYLGVVWVDDTSIISCIKVLGTLGCDTSRSCHDYHRIAFPNFSGCDYNIVYWADTSKKLN